MNTARNIYRDGVDFSQLALQDTEFNKYLKTNGQVNFGDPKAVKQLTLSLLARDFSLTLTLPPTRLCPPIPNRLNYILWLQDLVDQTRPSLTPHLDPSNTPPDSYDPLRPVLGIDIGTGASAIYPLLGTTLRSSWRFLATDIDGLNLEFARQNVSGNKLGERVRFIRREGTDDLIPVDVLDAAGIQHADFVMCNPPFFSSTSELLAGAQAKSRPPNSACTGAEIEMVCAGGEVGFVTRMVNESARAGVRDRIQWFSSMLGKLSSVGTVVESLKREGCTNWCVTEFVQGNKTRRWAVAWSWGGWRPTLETGRGVGAAALGGLGRGVLCWPSEVVVPVRGVRGEETGRKVDERMKGLDLRWWWRPDEGVGVGSARENVWSRSARRKKKMEGGEGNGGGGDRMDEDGEENEGKEPALGFRIEVRETADEEQRVEVEIRWLVGQDSVLFESFCGMMTRSLSNKS